MSHLITQNVLEFDNTLAEAPIGEQNTMPQLNQLNLQSNLIFSDIEKQMNLSASQLAFEHNPQNSSNNFNIDTNSGVSLRSESLDRSQMGSSYNSSPESNFPYTPVDTLDSSATTTSLNLENNLVKNVKEALLDEEDILALESKIHNNPGQLSDEESQHHNTVENPTFLLNDDLLDKQIEQIISAPVDHSLDLLVNKKEVTSLPIDLDSEDILTSSEQIETKSKVESHIKDKQNIAEEKSLKRSHAEFSSNSEDIHLKGINNNKKVKREESRVKETPAKDNKFLKCFSILRSNYLSLCSSYNEILDKLSATEAENKILKEKTEAEEREREQWEMDRYRYELEREDMKAMLDGLLHEVTVLRNKERKRKVKSTIGEMMLIKDERN